MLNRAANCNLLIVSPTSLLDLFSRLLTVFTNNHLPKLFSTSGRAHSMGNIIESETQSLVRF
jgi:hypothetical protein